MSRRQPVIAFACLGLVGVSCSFSALAVEQLTDPTKPANYQPVATAKGGLSSLKLEQIVSSASRQFAVIDGQKVTVGQQVGQYQIIDIKPKEVLLKQSDGSDIRLTLFTQIKQ
ncbi:hypothetical protein IC617_16770 [Neiella sp. HB171785]|uniref:MSHA biogenesis protein MshK n=1 Tax=Neiella litorisoli TaxID=2771431 RepID=A0A8J6UJS9_9GAMM|nr:hypothetical protein [Neiella litorisoli]MBD1391083.1 hypothetical protein [Neiella litorisoli]